MVTEKTTRPWATSSTPTSRVRGDAIIPAKKLCTQRTARHTSDGADSERPRERGLHHAAGGGERKENYLPDVSALGQEMVEVDPDPKETLKVLDFGSLSNLQVAQPRVGMNFKTPRGAI